MKALVREHREVRALLGECLVVVGVGVRNGHEACTALIIDMGGNECVVRGEVQRAQARFARERVKGCVTAAEISIASALSFGWQVQAGYFAQAREKGKDSARPTGVLLVRQACLRAVRQGGDPPCTAIGRHCLAVRPQRRRALGQVVSAGSTVVGDGESVLERPAGRVGLVVVHKEEGLVDELPSWRAKGLLGREMVLAEEVLGQRVEAVAAGNAHIEGVVEALVALHPRPHARLIEVGRCLRHGGEEGVPPVGRGVGQAQPWEAGSRGQLGLTQQGGALLEGEVVGV
jgi:hypothetical protein